MDQILSIFRNLSARQKITLAMAAAVVVGSLYALSHWNKERGFKPLLSGMSAEDAGAVVAKIREAGVEYRLAENGSTILVPAEKAAELRLTLAGAGLPKSGRIGFELFDKTNFGASEFTEHVNFNRAIEGELERSVMSLGEVEQARVHVTPSKDSLYTESRQPAKASVLVTLRPGARLSAQNIASICQLTASAVQGLTPESVSVVDTAGNLLNRPRYANPAVEGGEASEASLDYRKSIERDLQAKIAQTLEPLLGADHFRAGVSVEIDFSSGEQSEETYDPEKSVMLSSQKSEDGPSAAQASGVPGTASNLPRPTSRPASGSASFARRTENVTYQSSRVVRRTKIPQGSVKRVSMSVLVDHTVQMEGEGNKARRVVEAPSPEKLKVIRDLVAAATGIRTERGDQLVVESFPFESTLAPPAALDSPVAAPAPVEKTKLPAWLEEILKNKILLGAGAGAVVALAGLTVFLMVRGHRRKKARVDTGALAIAAAAQKALPVKDEVQRELEAKLAAQAAERAKQTAEAVAALKLPAVATKKAEVLTRHIADEAKKDPTAMAHVVRSWLNGEDRR